MQLGMIGLGRMGANMVRRLSRAGHDCVVYDVDPEAVARLAREGATAAASPRELVEKALAQRPSLKAVSLQAEAQRKLAAGGIRGRLVIVF